MHLFFVIKSLNYNIAKRKLEYATLNGIYIYKIHL